MVKKKVGFTETVLRDAQQSLIATRLSFDKMAPVLSEIDQAGYYSVECWGGATFDVCLRYLNEDPWERLRKLRAAMPHSRLQMLLRGQNILGYKHYPDDIVRRFVKASIRNGIDIIRIFDALNDLENLKVAIDATLEAGATASGTICYTTSPVHTIGAYVKMAEELKAMGVSTICIKDMAGILTPKNAYDLVSGIKAAVDLPLVVHTHSTTGTAFMTYLCAVEAGADVIDTAIGPMSGGTSQPATETLCIVLNEMGYDTGLDTKILFKLAEYFKAVRAEYLENGTLNPISMGTDAACLEHQIPGGMLSNLLSQLKMMNALDKYEDALKETPRVRKDMGYPPLVTPTSQIIGNQAVNNVLSGERYKNVSNEIKAYCRGEYGKTPAPIDSEIRAKILGDEKPLQGRYAATLPADTFEKAREELGDTAKSEEDILSYIAFPQVADAFFKARREEEEKLIPYSIKPMEE